MGMPEIVEGLVDLFHGRAFFQEELGFAAVTTLIMRLPMKPGAKHTAMTPIFPNSG